MAVDICLNGVTATALPADRPLFNLEACIATLAVFETRHFGNRPSAEDKAVISARHPATP